MNRLRQHFLVALFFGSAGFFLQPTSAGAQSWPTTPPQAQGEAPYRSPDRGGYGAFTYTDDGPPPPPRARGWQARNLLQGPAAIVKGVGAAVWCIGNSSYVLYRNVHSVLDVISQTLIWPIAVTIDSVGTAAAYEGIGVAHTITGGALVADPPMQMEEMNAPIYCVFSDTL